MSKLADLRSKSTPVTLSDGTILNLMPINLDIESEVARLQTEEKIFEAIKLMVTSAIKGAMPDATEEEINHLNKKDLKLVTEAVLSINGLKGDAEKKLENPSPSKNESI